MAGGSDLASRAFSGWRSTIQMTTEGAQLLSPEAVEERIDPALRRELTELVSEMCRAINEPKRLMVLYALQDRPRGVSELAQYLSMPQANTSQHLAVLRDRGLVEAERQGSRVVYGLRHPKVIDAIDLLRQVLTEEIARQHALRSSRGD